MSGAASPGRAPLRSLGRGLAVALVAASLAGLVRGIGIRHGEPSLIFHPDVSKQAAVARLVFLGKLNLAERYRTNHELAMYPYGTAVLTGWGVRLVRHTPLGARAADWSPWQWALRLRCFSLATACLAVACFGLLETGRLGLPATALAALLLAVEPYSAQYSHYGMNDVPLAALLILAWLAATRMPTESPRFPTASLACGFCVGLAVGVKYQAVLGLVFPAVAWWFARRAQPRAWRWRAPVAVALGLLPGVFLTVPQLHAPGMLAEALPEFFAWQANISGESLPLADKAWRNLRLFARFALDKGLWLLLPALALAALRALRRDADAATRLRVATAAAFPLVLLAVFAGCRDFLRSNDMVALTPFLVLLAGIGVATRGAASRHMRLAVAVSRLCLAALLVRWSVTSFRDSTALRRPDTRERAQAWCRANLPPGSRVLLERYTLPVNAEGIAEQTVRSFASRQAAADLAAGEWDYIVASSLSHDRFSDPLSPYHNTEAAELYRDLFGSLRLRAAFRDRELFFAHPEITVWSRRSPPAEGTPALRREVEEEPHAEGGEARDDDGGGNE